MTDPEFTFYEIHATVIEEGDNNRLYEASLTPPVCDFCLDTRVKWSYSCEEFVLGTFGSDDEWLACDRCSALIEASETRMLAERALESWRIRGNPPMEDGGDGLRKVQAAFLAHREGDREAFG